MFRRNRWRRLPQGTQGRPTGSPASLGCFHRLRPAHRGSRLRFENRGTLPSRVREPVFLRFGGRYSQAQDRYADASHINAQATACLRHGTERTEGNQSASHCRSTASSLTQTIQQHIPNWEALFGSTSFCECGECGSVYGAAAYFVDLLQFLRNSKPNSSGFHAAGCPYRREGLPTGIGTQARSALHQAELPKHEYAIAVHRSCQRNSGKLHRSGERERSGRTAQPFDRKNTPSDASPDELAVNPEYTDRRRLYRVERRHIPAFPSLRPLPGRGAAIPCVSRRHPAASHPVVPNASFRRSTAASIAGRGDAWTQRRGGQTDRRLEPPVLEATVPSRL